MLYNKNYRRIKKPIDCMTCACYDKTLKECKGLNKVCFEYDEKTQTLIDGITKLPIKL